MPEGPEIRRAADQIGEAVAGKVVPEVWFAFPRLEAFAGELSGRTVTSIDARGKAILTRFDVGLTVYTHNQLFGRWYIVKAGALPSGNRQLRFALKGERIWALLYSAAEIEVLTPEQEREHPYLSHLGPDVLDERVTAAAVGKRLQEHSFAGRQLAALLLDQSCLSGPGNYLRSEILFAARIDPHRRPRDLSGRESATLGRACKELSQRAYLQRGSTVAPARLRELKASKADGRDLRHLVFNREGRPCPRCKKAVVREVLANRRLYWCDTCQR